MGKEFQIFLPEELAADVAKAVAEGEHASEEEVIRFAIEQWSGHRLLDAMPVGRLRELVQEGLDSGPGRDRSIDEIIAEARERFENR